MRFCRRSALSNYRAPAQEGLAVFGICVKDSTSSTAPISANSPIHESCFRLGYLLGLAQQQSDLLGHGKQTCSPLTGAVTILRLSLRLLLISCAQAFVGHGSTHEHVSGARRRDFVGTLQPRRQANSHLLRGPDVKSVGRGHGPSCRACHAT